MFFPLNRQLLIEIKKKEDTTPGGIVVPVTNREEQVIEGEVISIGDEVKKVKEGDKIIFKRYSMDVFKDMDKIYYFVDEVYVLSLIK